MGSGIVEAYRGTRGDFLEARRTGNYSRVMKQHVDDWARRKADELSQTAKRKRKDSTLHV